MQVPALLCRESDDISFMYRAFCRLCQVEAIDQTLGSILTDLSDVYDAFMIVWWRVLSGAPAPVQCSSRAPMVTCTICGRSRHRLGVPRRVTW